MALSDKMDKIKADLAEQERLRNVSANEIISGQKKPEPSSILSGSLEEQKGQLAGLSLGNLGYGQGIGQTGSDIQRVRELQRQRTEQSGGDPVSAAIMGQKAGQVAGAQRNLAASGVKGGTAAGAISNVARAADADIAASLYGQQRQSISDERSLASNTLAGQTSLMQGEKAANVAMPAAPQASSWTDSVLCTELHRQGILSNELYARDVVFGKFLEAECPEIITGYHFFAKPVVKLMKKSKIFTKLISYPVLSWAKYIASNFENKYIVGAIVFHLGIPVCSIVGSIKNKLSGAKYV